MIERAGIPPAASLPKRAASAEKSEMIEKTMATGKKTRTATQTTKTQAFFATQHASAAAIAAGTDKTTKTVKDVANMQQASEEKNRATVVEEGKPNRAAFEGGMKEVSRGMFAMAASIRASAAPTPQAATSGPIQSPAASTPSADSNLA